MSPNLAVPFEHHRPLFAVNGGYRVNGTMGTNLNFGFDGYAKLCIDVSECANVRLVTELQPGLVLDDPVIRLVCHPQ